MLEVDVFNLTQYERELLRDIYFVAKDEHDAARIMTKLYELIATGLFRLRKDEGHNRTIGEDGE